MLVQLLLAIIMIPTLICMNRLWFIIFDNNIQDKKDPLFDKEIISYLKIGSTITLNMSLIIMFINLSDMIKLIL
jgi:hypothetical protein